MNQNEQKHRLIIYLFSALLLLAANIVIFNSAGIYRNNVAEFEAAFFSMMAVLAPWASGAVFLALCTGALLPPAWLKKYATFLATLAILTWIQASFLAWDYGVFDGRDRDWSRFDGLGWMDIGLWVVLLTASLRFTRQVAPILGLVTWILLLGQGALLIGQGGAGLGENREPPVATHEIPGAIQELSKQQNIFHIILDSMQSDVFLEVLETSDLYDDLEGFSLFYENAGVTPHTSLALPAIFSGELFDGSKTPDQYYRDAMSDGFQNALYRAGFTVNLIPHMSMRDSNYSNYYQIPSTFTGTVEDLVAQNAAQLLDVSLFRSVPHYARKMVFNDGDWLVLPMVRGEKPSRSFQEKIFFSEYTAGLTVGGESPAYHFLHLYPPHPPYETLADGSYAGRILPNTRENYLHESRAIVALVAKYLEKIKSLGAYDQAMIILQGDHGSQIDPVHDGRSVDTCVSRLPAMLAIKPPGGTGSMRILDAPTSLLDIAPTVLSLLDEKHESVFEIDADAPRTREFLVYRDRSDAANIGHFLINGSIYDPASCSEADPIAVGHDNETYRVGTQLRFGLTGNGGAFMDAGWSLCQAQHCWSMENQADLVLPVEPSQGDLVLTAGFIPFVDENEWPRQRIVVEVNGIELVEWSASRYESQSASTRIPAELTRESMLRVRFLLPDAVVPQQLGLGGDTRLLGIALLNLRLDEARD